VDHAGNSTSGQSKITFLNGDVLTRSFQPGSFDSVVAVATLHHLPLRNALERFRDLLRSGGVLVIVGLYRIATPVDYLFSAVALPISWAIRFSRGEEEVGAPLQDPTETLRTIRKECSSVLPEPSFVAGFSFATPLYGGSTEDCDSFTADVLQLTSYSKTLP
jgi:SAM-dependent methyltransferase